MGGSCDFSLETWTCGDLQAGDRTLAGFSINRYETSGILEMIQSFVGEVASDTACESLEPTTVDENGRTVFWKRSSSARLS